MQSESFECMAYSPSIAIILLRYPHKRGSLDLKPRRRRVGARRAIGGEPALQNVVAPRQLCQRHVDDVLLLVRYLELGYDLRENFAARPEVDHVTRAVADFEIIHLAAGKAQRP